MSKRIIAFVDGSIYSASVCDHTAWVAKRMDASVELLHVLGRRGTPTPSEGLGTRSALQAELAAVDEQRARLVTHRGIAILEDARHMLTKSGLQAVSSELVHGDLLDTLARHEMGAEMVLIGKRGEAADFAIEHLGSNLERIVRTATHPVLVASRAFRPIKKVLVAHDGGASSLKAIDYIARSPLFPDLQITVVAVGVKTAETERRLTDAAALLRGGGIATETLTVGGVPDVALGNLVDSAGFDMLVMGAYGHSRIRSLIIGSTTTAMIRSCKVPVLLVR
ncbi:universal stress protein [Sinirhodobacter ferrireducens]|uniref:Universal stress protein n=1 Tax=Paenirhodobacter ferrireducens TaxID=1215032 RepID=A0A443LDT5_9RHOB|nr:universal stress protein [Sinirhodobacter ferrireducens]RWR47296.1 universal stress protein [Sinirhodobacter ferrireducens]